MHSAPDKGNEVMSKLIVAGERIAQRTCAAAPGLGEQSIDYVEMVKRRYRLRIATFGQITSRTP
jgi:hypothetical protein